MTAQEAEWLKKQVDFCLAHHPHPPPSPKSCSACPAKQQQLESATQQLQQLQTDLRGKDREVQELQAKLQRFAGLKQVRDSVHLLCMLLLPAGPNILSHSMSCLLCLAARLEPVMTAQQLKIAESGWLQILETMQHARGDVDSFDRQLVHAKQDIDDAAAKLQAMIM